LMPIVLYYFYERICDIRKGSNPIIKISNAVIKKSNVFVEIDTGSTGFAYHTGMYCMLNVPAISQHQWHPFTIASGGGKSKFQVLIAFAGDWTKRLKELLAEAQAKSESEGNGNEVPYPTICVRGGYGAPAEGMKDKKHIVMVGGGVGATPFLSFMSNICDSAKRGIEDQFVGVESAVFYWLSREPDEFVWVNEYNSIINSTPFLKGKVEVRLVMTRNLDTKEGWDEKEVGLLWMGVEIALNEFDASELAEEMGVPTQFGRPKWEKEFDKHSKDLDAKHGKTKREVSVFVCANKMLVGALEEACAQASGRRTKFRLYAEEF